eukprot:GHUV01013442.1.p1 GENE.GHUV01013442.1~~GHUV01013442.1.p1  ORF type:complete len:198 (+),score=55.92 GHUV01013442.1:334-927(+)
MTVPATEDWRDVSLFGDAMNARLPRRFVDVSDFRPVPDHQEVWADGATDQSVVIEIAEHSNVSDAEVGRFVFDDLAAANEASSSSITDVKQLGSADIPHFAAGTYACLVSGIQEASKGRDGPERSNKVYMLLCVVRLPQHGSDLLVTVNAPAYISPSSSAAQYTEQQGIQPQAEAQAAAVIRGVLSSLQVVDVGLFS